LKKKILFSGPRNSMKKQGVHQIQSTGIMISAMAEVGEIERYRPIQM
jgi:hypothetical protein